MKKQEIRKDLLFFIGILSNSQKILVASEFKICVLIACVISCVFVGNIQIETTIFVQNIGKSKS